MATIRSYESFYSRAPAGHEPRDARNQRFLIAAWWTFVALAGVLTTIFGREVLPAKFTLDAATIHYYLEQRGLWDSFSLDGFVNTARVWFLVFQVLPEAVAIPAYYSLLVVVATRVLDLYAVRPAAYHVLAGGWVLCAAIFLSVPSKEMVALPVALWFCLAGSWGARLLATALFLSYAVFFRQYWLICFVYFVFVLIAVRLHVAKRTRLAACTLLLGFALPFLLADTLGFEPLTESRMTVNVDRVDSPDARSAFDNPLENTGPATDIANAVVSWFYMNVPVALLPGPELHYIFFAAFQLWTLWFFGAGCARLLRDAKRIRRSDGIHLRCAAFVIAYSWTQALFEPDFGSFLRHEIVVMIPMLIVVFYRAHAVRLQAGENPLRA